MWLSKIWMKPCKHCTEQERHHNQNSAVDTAEGNDPVTDFNELCHRLAKNDVSLVCLDLRDQKLQSDDAAALASALRINENVRMLNVGNSNLGDKGILQILLGLKDHKSLEYLILSSNEATNVAEFASLFVHMHSLKWLDLSNNSIRKAGALLQAVGVHNSIELLDLSLNQISDGDAIGQAIRQCSTLKELNLFANYVDNDGAEAIAASELGRLVKLNLGYNRIGDAGAKILLTASTKSPTMKEIVLTGNPCSLIESRSRMRSAYAA